MILTTCAACAAPLAHTAPQCGRCQTRYCGRPCQVKHWNEGGHKALCKKIKKGGGAEQYHADKKYKEAVAVAVEACADDTKGQTCYICTQALHWKTKEGLVRGCACRGTAGFAHVSCLAEQAKILVAEAEENNLGDKAWNERFRRWDTCGLCEQRYHGVAYCALGWACWKTYVGRPEADWARVSALTELGNGLSNANYDEDALSVQEAELSLKRRIGAASRASVLGAQGNLANTYKRLGRDDQTLDLRRDVYSGFLKLNGEAHETTIHAASDYANSLSKLKRHKEAKSLLRKMMPVARRGLGEGHGLTLKMRGFYAQALYTDPATTLDALREAVMTLEDAERIALRVFGGGHPTAVMMVQSLRQARAALGVREGDVESLRAAVEAMTPGDA